MTEKEKNIFEQELRAVGESGASDPLYETIDKLNDFQSALQDCAFELQEACR